MSPSGFWTTTIAVATLIVDANAAAQARVGRGAPLPPRAEAIIGPDGKGMAFGPGLPDNVVPIFAAKDGAAPPGVSRCRTTSSRRRTSTRTASSGPIARYYRCNSAVGLEQIWGAYEVPPIGDDPPRSAAWGFCDRDYPREEIVSPYGFKTAKEHYAALLAERRARGGPTVYTQATLPDWNGRYRRQRDKTRRGSTATSCRSRLICRC